jgi:hypothetical protein
VNADVRSRSKPVDESTRISVDSSPPAANTRGATPERTRARPKWLIKAKGKSWTRVRARSPSPKSLNLSRCGHMGPSRSNRGGSIPQARPVVESVKETPVLKKRLANMPPQVARILKLIDKSEDLEALQPLEAASRPVPTVPTPDKESDVELIKGPLVKKRKLIKAVEVAAP